MKEEKEDYREDTPDAAFSEEDSEIIIFDLGDSEDAGRQVQAVQPDAAVERVFLNDGDCLRNHQMAQRGAVHEHRTADGCDGGRP